MFVKTENHGIINLNCYPRVDVVEHDGAWLLKAFIETDAKKADFFQGEQKGLAGFLLAKFNEEIQANYSFCHLYSTLEAGLFVWDPSAVESFSGLWNKAKNELSSNKPSGKPFIHLEILNPLELKITGLREITILFTNILENEKDNIENKIKNTLKAVDPMQEAVWKVDWKDIEDEIPPVHV